MTRLSCSRNSDGNSGGEDNDTASTIADDDPDQENIPPSTPASKADSEDRPLCDFGPALVAITPPKLTIKQTRVGENDELSFVVGFGGLVWVSYSQVRCNRRVQTFMKALKQSQWKEFLTEQEGRRLQPASLDYGPYGSQMEVKEVLHIMLWNGQWMFEIRAAHLVLDYEGVCGMGLVDNAADFLHANGGDAGVVD